jgi:AcrR family transcriptional regulator
MRGRAALAEETRERIVEGACELYASEGFRNGSMQAIARAADVSPATVMNHFGTSDDVLKAALERWSARFELVDAAIVRELGPLESRVDFVTHVVVGAYEANRSWLAAYLRDRDIPLVRAAGDALRARVESIVRAALDPRAGARSVAVVMTLLSPANVLALRDAGLDDAGEVVKDLILGWLARRKRRRKA